MTTLVAFFVYHLSYLLCGWFFLELVFNLQFINITFVSAQILETSKGKRVVILNGYSYHCSGAIGSRFRWRCSARQRSRCCAVVYTYGDHIVELRKEHNHPPLINTKHGNASKNLRKVGVSTSAYVTY